MTEPSSPRNVRSPGGADASAPGAATPRERLVPPPGADFWVFGYGSLMWHPGFPHLEVRNGVLHGYHRHFCVFSHHYRGTPASPGLVLGLDRGGSCHGLVYRVPAAEGESAMDYLYEREMVTGVYKPRWVGVRTSEGRVTAAAFIVDPHHAQYAGRLAAEEVVDLILGGQGNRGSCIAYLQNTVRHLRGLGIHDRPLEKLLRQVEQRRPNGP